MVSLGGFVSLVIPAGGGDDQPPLPPIPPSHPPGQTSEQSGGGKNVKNIYKRNIVIQHIYRYLFTTICMNVCVQAQVLNMLVCD